MVLYNWLKSRRVNFKLNNSKQFEFWHYRPISCFVSAAQLEGAIWQETFLFACLFVCFDLGFHTRNPVIKYRPDASCMSHMEARAEMPWENNSQSPIPWAQRVADRVHLRLAFLPGLEPATRQSADRRVTDRATREG